MRILVLNLITILLPAIAAAQTPLLTEIQRAEGEAKVAQAGGFLASSLRDPSSALFRNVFLRKTIGRDGKEYINLCGEVNSKNGYGGMSGWHAFMLGEKRVWVGGAGQIINADEICNNGRGVFDSRDYSPELRIAFNSSAGL